MSYVKSWQSVFQIILILHPNVMSNAYNAEQFATGHRVAVMLVTNEYVMLDCCDFVALLQVLVFPQIPMCWLSV